jgi:hypothetical protein
MRFGFRVTGKALNTLEESRWPGPLSGQRGFELPKYVAVAVAEHPHRGHHHPQATWCAIAGLLPRGGHAQQAFQQRARSAIPASAAAPASLRRLLARKGRGRMAVQSLEQCKRGAVLHHRRQARAVGLSLVRAQPRADALQAERGRGAARRWFVKIAGQQNEKFVSLANLCPAAAPTNDGNGSRERKGSQKTHEEGKHGQTAGVPCGAASRQHVVGPCTVVAKYLQQEQKLARAAYVCGAGMTLANTIDLMLAKLATGPDLVPLPHLGAGTRLRGVGANEHAAVVADAFPHRVRVRQLHLQVLWCNDVRHADGRFQVRCHHGETLRAQQ